MPSLRCDHCEKLFEYREQIVVLRETDSGVEALRETELEAGTVEGAFEPVGSTTSLATKRYGAKLPTTGPNSTLKAGRASQSPRLSVTRSPTASDRQGSAGHGWG